MTEKASVLSTPIKRLSARFCGYDDLVNWIGLTRSDSPRSIIDIVAVALDATGEFLSGSL